MKLKVGGFTDELTISTTVNAKSVSKLYLLSCGRSEGTAACRRAVQVQPARKATPSVSRRITNEIRT